MSEPMVKILYQDEILLLAQKPVGISTEQSDRYPDIVSLLRKDGIEGTLLPVNRLDTATGGILLLCRDARQAGKLAALVSGGGYHKEYLAVIHGKPERESGRFVDWLYHDKTKNKTFVVKRERRGVKEAILEYRVLAEATANGENFSLVSVRLLTGRTHQIRVQFASRKTPIVGDGKYGSRDNRASTALWSHRATFLHPDTKEPIAVVSCPDTDAYPWCLFGEKIFGTSESQ